MNTSVAARRPWRRHVGLAIALLFSAAACSKSTPPPATTAPGTTAPTAATKPATPTGERYFELVNRSEPEYLDPNMMSGTVEAQIAVSVFEGLMTFDPKDSTKVVPGVAERYEISPDGLVYTFHLRPTAKWSDGKPVTAKDFIYSWQRVLDPKLASSYAFILYYMKNAKGLNTGALTDMTQLGAKALDDHTLQVTLEHATPFFPNLTAFHTYFPVPQWAVEAHGNEWTKPEYFVGNGPFMVKTWVPHKELLTVKNPHYWDAANVKIPGVRYHPIDDNETALKMYEAGQVDVAWELPTIKIPALMQRPDGVEAPFLTTYFYRFNVTKAPFDNPKVRRAFALAVDRKTLCEQYLQKTHLPWASMVPAGMGSYTPAAGPDFNLAEAKKLLAEAGYPDGAGFPSVQLLYNTHDMHKLIAQVIQQMWKQNLGVNIELVNQEWKSYLKDQREMNYQISRAGWIADYADPSAFLELWTSESGENQTGWKNPQYDALMQQAGREPDAAKRNTLLQQAETLFLAESPVVAMFTYKRQMLIKPYVKGYQPNLMDIHPAKWVTLDPNAATAKQ